MAELPWKVDPGAKVRLTDSDSSATGGLSSKEEAELASERDLERLLDLQGRFHIDGRRALLLVLQGMDTSGKDGMIRHLSRGLSLLGVDVTAFAAPTAQEAQHDFLWRIHQKVPARGRIGIFNRSHYEDVLAVRVRGLAPEKVWRARYRQINEFERLLTDTGTLVLKCFLHISKEEQRQRLQARLVEPDKLWKFDPHDIEDRQRWKTYQEAYEDALVECSTEAAPWYIVPADRKWVRNFAVTRLLIRTLGGLDFALPVPTFDPRTIDLH